MKQNDFSFPDEAERSLKRLLSKIEHAFSRHISTDINSYMAFKSRLEKHFPDLFRLYYHLYGTRYDFFYHLDGLMNAMATAFFQRPSELRVLDTNREEEPNWFQSNNMVGGVCYVDLFSGNLSGLRKKIPYFKELGLTYLHLMPFFKMPEGENDGGYAISSFREVHPPLGTMSQLSELAKELRTEGISMVADLIINHTSDQHNWALKAKAGDPEFVDMYGIFPDRSTPDLYERNLREIFPEEHTGGFTWFEDIHSWVWTTFHSYQWDLNYANPAVFNHMAEEMLFLANQGIEIFRLDAVAFIWKELGTSCENLPEAHIILQGFNAVTQIVAPAILLKSEAIVHPDDVIKYISPAECQISYNPLLMALLWNSLATRKVDLLVQALSTRFRLPNGTAWINYVRCHDDIGWTFSDEDAVMLGVRGNDHRKFLNDFYRGKFPGSFARGLPFQENPKTGDTRISGTCASLAGLEKAINEEGETEVELAIRRITLLYAIVMTVGGIPLIYLGDEIGTLNDYGYLDDLDHQHDSRWVHRPVTDWSLVAMRQAPTTIQGQVYDRIVEIIHFRKANPAIGGTHLEMINSENKHVLGYARSNAKQRLGLFGNFSEQNQTIPVKVLQQNNLIQKTIIFGKSNFDKKGNLLIRPLDFVILG